MARRRAGADTQPDFFGDPTLAGLRYQDDIVSCDEEQALVARIDEAGLAPFKFQQWTGKRLTRSFGWSYDFATGGFAPTAPIPPWLEDVRRRAALLAGLDPELLVQVLLIRYDPGAAIGWHRDRPVFGHVVGISLGASTVMRFRRRTGSGFARMSVPLAPRSAYHLGGEARHEWEHSIAPMDAPRWSITFRSLAGGGKGV